MPAIRLVGGLDLVGALADGIPAHRLGVGALGQHGDAVGDDESGIEADAELADELRVLRGIPAQALEKFLRAGTRDGAEIVDHLIAAHADAVVLDGQGARGGVRYQRHRERIGAEERGIGERLEAQLLARIRGIRDQLAQKNLLVRVERMNDEPQDLLGLGLELFDLRLCFGGHGITVVCFGPTGHQPRLHGAAAADFKPDQRRSRRPAQGQPARGSKRSSRFMRSYASRAAALSAAGVTSLMITI